MRKISRVASLKEKILNDINSGTLRSGDKIASRHQFMIRYKCARGSIDQAIKELTDDGFLYSRQGAGTYVAERNPGSDKIRRVYIVGNFERNYLKNAFLESGSIASEIQSYADCMLCRVDDAVMNLNDMARRGSAVIWQYPDYRLLMAMEFLRKANVPQLLLQRNFDGYDYIITDSYAGIDEGLKWLINREGREIAFISTRNSLKYPYVVERKIDFFEQAILNSVSIRPEWLFVDWQHELEFCVKMKEVADVLFNCAEPCRAVYLDYATWCGAFLREAERLGKLPGRDFSLLLFDTVESGFNQPGVAMIRQDTALLTGKILEWVLGKTGSQLNFKIKPKLIKTEEHL
ncbi:MAG: GntR family transcriptional regulator [Victivallaceae bacterium]|nr:GntR family transcriptional regulator [Victivallaceae bacterium]MDD4317950.1 GntR family transcriptional regulator [Victivallaceae bacterium]NLK83416.1 GntR family transcriptional regulator [Lentisphaerota bacterium]